MMKALKLYGGVVSFFSHMSLLPPYYSQQCLDKLNNLNDLNQSQKQKPFIEVDWHDLSGKIIHNKNVVLTQYGDVHFYNGPVFMCEKLFLIQCDKNFVFHWMDKRTFPNLREVYIGSHPCEPCVLTDNKFDTVYLHEAYTSYKEMWWPDEENVKLISDENYEAALKNYDEVSEEIIMSENK